MCIRIHEYFFYIIEAKVALYGCAFKKWIASVKLPTYNDVCKILFVTRKYDKATLKIR